MTRERKASFADRNIILALVCLPAFDSILNQVSGAFQLTVGPASLLEVFRGMLLFGFVLLIVYRIAREPRTLASIPLPAVAALFLLGVIVTKQMLLTGSLASEAAVAYGQMTYWVLLWIVTSLFCTEKRQAELILLGLAIGAVVTAVSVLLGLAYGGVNYYETDDVLSSAGWFHTAKMISAVLVSGTIVILYLGRQKRVWLSVALALLCSVACFLTYARAGSVAFCCGFLWLGAWYVRSSKIHAWRSLKLFFGMIASLAVVAVALVPSQALFSRWSDLSDSDQAGSGRASIWRVATDSYFNSSTVETIMGTSYDAMSETLLRGYGEDVKHTHNDMLDMLLVAGVLGAAWLLFMVGYWLSQIKRISFGSCEGAAAGAILLNFLCHSQFTGQLWGTDSMSYYMIALSSLSVLGKHTFQERRSSSTKRFELIPTVEVSYAGVSNEL